MLSVLLQMLNSVQKSKEGLTASSYNMWLLVTSGANLH